MTCSAIVLDDAQPPGDRCGILLLCSTYASVPTVEIITASSLPLLVPATWFKSILSETQGSLKTKSDQTSMHLYVARSQPPHP